MYLWVCSSSFVISNIKTGASDTVDGLNCHFRKNKIHTCTQSDGSLTLTDEQFWLVSSPLFFSPLTKVSESSRSFLQYKCNSVPDT